MDMIKSLLGKSNVIEEVLTGVGAHYAKKAIIRAALVAGVLALVLGLVGGWVTRDFFIEHPEELIASEQEYLDRIDTLEDSYQKALDSSDSHEEKAADLLAQLEAEKPVIVLNEPVMIQMTALLRSGESDYEKGRAAGAKQMQGFMQGYVNDLHSNITEWENRETIWQELTTEHQASISDLRASLVAAIERGDAAVERERKWSQAEISDVIAWGPMIGATIWPDVSPGIGVAIIVDIPTAWSLLGG